MSTCHPIEAEETRARSFIKETNEEFTRQRNILAEAEWAYESNITDTNIALKNDVAAKAAIFAREKAKEIREFNFNAFKDEDLKRQFKKLSTLDYFALSDEKYKELLNVIDEMQSNYAKVKVCDYKDATKCDLSLEPEISAKFEKSHDPEELKYYWTKWYDAAGTPSKANFLRYTELVNEAARLNSNKIFKTNLTLNIYLNL